MAQAKPQTNQNAKTAARCSLCGEPVNAAFRPFCSKRCADVDLLRWLNGGYAIAGGQTDEDDDRGTDEVEQPQPPLINRTRK